MALVAWWPLNGDTDNYCNGIYGASAINTSEDVNGKIGKCIAFNSGYLKLNKSPIFNKEEFSVSFWFKTSNVSSTQNFGCSRGIVGGGFSIFLINSVFRFDLAPTNGDPIHHWTTKYKSFSSNTWYHITLTRDIHGRNFYINGKLEEFTLSAGVIDGQEENIFSIGASTTDNVSFNNYLIGSLNDYRIYDHALSEEEVKEIAKAKILHWTFNENAEPTENLASGKLIDYDNDGWHSISRSSSQAEQIKNLTKANIIVKPNTVYTVRWETKSEPDANTSNLYLRFNGTGYPEGTNYLAVDRDSAYSYIIKNRIKKKIGNITYFETTFQTTADTSSIILIRMDNDVPSTTTYVRRIQIEEKPYATEYVDGIREGIVVDNSGFGNHGTIDMATSPKWTDKSKFGSGCYYFADSNKNTIIKTNSNFLLPKDSFTISYWLNETMLYNGSYDRFHIGQTLSSSPTVLGWKFLTGYGTDGGYFRAANSSGNVISNRTAYVVNSNQWINFVCRFNSLDNTLSFFRDGIKIGSFAATNFNTTLNHYPFSIGNSIGLTNRMNGYFDDTRVYATALSDEDIKDMYRAKITEDGVFKAHGIVEAQNWRKLGNNLIDYSVWRSQYLTKPNGALPNLSIYGNSAENTRVYSENPWGGLDIVWKGTNERNYIYQNNGFNYTMTADTTKKYRLSLWVKRKNGPSSSSKGAIYFGTTNSSSNPLINIVDGSESTNPYWITNVSTNEEWVLLVGYIQAHTDTTTTVSSESGSYKITGKLSSHGREFRFKEGYPRLIFRTFLYNCQEPDTQVLYYRPRIDCCDGTEPSIQDLLAGYEDGREIRPQIDSKNQLCLGEVSEVGARCAMHNTLGVTRGLAGYWDFTHNGIKNIFPETKKNVVLDYNAKLDTEGVKTFGNRGQILLNGTNCNSDSNFDFMSASSKHKEFTISCYFRADGENKVNEGGILYRPGGHHGLVFNSTGFIALRIPFATGGTQWIYSKSSVKVGTSYHAVAVFTADKMKLYVDGVLHSEKSIIGCVLNDSYKSTNFVAGSTDSSRFWSHITIFEVKFFNKALTDYEIAKEYKRVSETDIVYKPMTRDGVLHMKEFNEID